MSEESQFYAEDLVRFGSADAQMLRRLLVFLKPYWKMVVVATVLLLANTGLVLAIPMVLRNFVDNVLTPMDGERLYRYGLIIFVLVTAYATVSATQGYLFTWIGQRVMFDIRRDLFAHVQRLPIRYYDKNPVGRLVTRVTNDIASLNELFAGGFVQLINDTFLIGGIIVAMFVLDSHLAAWVCLVFPPLFFLIGMIYERYHTRDMRRMGGLAKRMPVWSFFMVFFVLASVGLPGLNGFVSEFLCLIAAFIATPDAPTYPGLLGPWYAAAAGLGMIFAAMYLLIMVGRVVFGPLKEPALEDEHLHHGPSLPADLTLREIGVLVPLAALCLYFGFQPGVLTDVIEPAAERVLAGYPEIVDAYRPEIMAADVPPAPAGLEFTLEGARTDG